MGWFLIINSWPQVTMLIIFQSVNQLWHILLMHYSWYTVLRESEEVTTGMFTKRDWQLVRNWFKQRNLHLKKVRFKALLNMPLSNISAQYLHWHCLYLHLCLHFSEGWLTSFSDFLDSSRGCQCAMGLRGYASISFQWSLPKPSAPHPKRHTPIISLWPTLNRKE